MPRVRRTRWIKPKEADGIAAQFRSAAGQIRQLAGQLRSVNGTLDANWEGNSKNRFSEAFGPEPGKLDDYAGWLDDRAREIENIRVSETYWEDIP